MLSQTKRRYIAYYKEPIKNIIGELDKEDKKSQNVITRLIHQRGNFSTTQLVSLITSTHMKKYQQHSALINKRRIKENHHKMEECCGNR